MEMAVNETQLHLVSVSNIIYISVEFLLMVAILFGNLLTVAVVARFSHLQTVTNKFVMSLAMSDIMVGLVIPYHSMFYIFPSLNSHKIACLLYYAFMTLSCGVSIISLTTISLDRYIAIFYPLRYAGLMTGRTSNVVIAGVWLYTSSFSFLLLFWNGWNDDSWKLECQYLQVAPSEYIYVFLVSQFIILSTVMLSIYMLIFKEVHRHKRQIHLLTIQGGKVISIKKEAKTATTLAIVMGLFLTCWLPYFLVVLAATINRSLYVDEFYNGTILLGIFNSCLNPIVYGWKKKEFRRAYQSLLHLNRLSSEAG